MPPEAGEDADPPSSVRDLQAAVDELRAEAARSTRRIAALEARLGVPESGAPAGPAPPPARDLPSRPAASDWEWLLGGSWLARAGIAILVVGIGLFFKLAFDNRWIGEAGRVILGVAAGLALLGGGEYWRQRYPGWARILTGGGLAALYLSVFAAFSLYGLVPASVALGFVFLTTLASALLALRYEARDIAVLGILGGFAVPLILAARLPDPWMLLAYVLVLDLGVLALAAFRNWRYFTLLGLLGSLFLFERWRMEADPGLLLAQSGLTAIFLVFVGANLLFPLLWRRDSEPLDQPLMAFNAAAYFGLSYWMLSGEIREWMGAFTLLLALFYGLLGYGLVSRRRQPEPLGLFAASIGLVFLGIAVPVQLDGTWVGVAWAVQAAVLVWLSFLPGMRPLRRLGAAAFAIVALRLLVFDTFPPGLEPYRPLANERFFAFATGIWAMYFAARLLWQRRDGDLYPEDRFLVPGLLVAANFLSLWVLSFETVDSVGYFDLGGNAASLGLSVLWAVYAVLAIVCGIVARSHRTRLAGLGLLALPIAKLFLYDTFGMALEYRVAAYVGLGAILLAGGYLYQRYGRIVRKSPLE